MMRLGVLSSKAIALAALINFGAPAYAGSASDCLETAFIKMLGGFSATGMKLDAEGELTDFQNTYEVRAVAGGESCCTCWMTNPRRHSSSRTEHIPS